MKYFYIAILIVLASISPAQAEQGKNLFILSGQSNMSRMNTDKYFTPIVEKTFGKDKVIVVKDATGGQPIRRWYKKWKPAKNNAPKASGDLYDHLMTKVNAAIKDKQIQTITFVWMQGERDAKEPYGEIYAASLKGLLDQLGEDLGRTDINFVIGRINNVNSSEISGTIIRKAQVDVAESLPHSAWVNTDDLNGLDNETGVHATQEGYKILGARFAEKSIQLIQARHP